MVKILNPQIAKIVPRLDQSNAWVIRVLVLIGIVAVLGLTVTYMASSKLASIDYQVYGKVQVHQVEGRVAGVGGMGQEH